jgi:hypothetical protein
MKMSTNIGAIAGALSEAQGMIEAAVKKSENPFFKNKYAALNDLREAIRVPLKTNGLSIAQFASFDPEFQLVSVECMLMHSSGEWMSEVFSIPVVTKNDREGKPLPADPQSIGSCVSYARRYSLASLLNLAAEDDDGNAGAGLIAAPTGKASPAAYMAAKSKRPLAQEPEL